MARSLDVYLNYVLTGHLTQDAWRRHKLRVRRKLASRARRYAALSHSLPLGSGRFRRKRCHGSFGGILPEQGKREMVARNLGISARNDYAMWERIGGKCAGAVTFLPHGEAMPECQYAYRELTNAEPAAILRELPRRPLLAGEEGVRPSLAGAQDKLAVRIENGAVCLPLGSAPSTHILKPGGRAVRKRGIQRNLLYAARYDSRSVCRTGRGPQRGRLFSSLGGTTTFTAAARRASRGCTRRTSARRSASRLSRSIRRKAVLR